jgi:ABC-type dipeptide/oligopeptide/nickel transport system ATPase component
LRVTLETEKGKVTVAVLGNIGASRYYVDGNSVSVQRIRALTADILPELEKKEDSDFVRSLLLPLVGRKRTVSFACAEGCGEAYLFVHPGSVVYNAERPAETGDRVGGYNIKDKEELNRNFERVYSLFPRLKERAKQQSSTLSGGEQQMLAIGRALMGSPKLLILDEPSLGLAPLLIKDIFKTLLKIKEEGTTILIVEQNALATLKIADYAYVLELGKIGLEGPASELVTNKKLIDAYLGG